MEQLSFEHSKIVSPLSAVRVTHDYQQVFGALKLRNLARFYSPTNGHPASTAVRQTITAQ